ncbi:MAG TPA: PKD domain-containing protein, partial [Candidatus Angelobacter sp.]|nr:PKD domain-containing protein [Candidatus Angelobacter sp.]
MSGADLRHRIDSHHFLPAEGFPMSRRCLPALLAVLVSMLATLAARAQDSTPRICPAACVAPAQACSVQAETCSPMGSPMTLSPSKHYFDAFSTSAIPLLGQSYEYLCHICQPERDSTYCTLTTYPGLFTRMQTNRNNVIRLETIFNHSPAVSTGTSTVPFCHEQPYCYTNGQWDLTWIDNNYITDLESVVCDASKKNMVVEVTLFNPWDGDWTTGPFHSANTVNQLGFTQRQYFMTFDHPSDSTDTDPRNIAARKAQRLAVTAVVNQLKKYPNVIWEVANEPDLLQVSGITKEEVFAWEQSMITTIAAADPAANDPTHTKAAHLVQINGHTADTFAWKDVNMRASVESAHYTFIKSSTLLLGHYYGAIDLMRDMSADTAARGTMAAAFNEDIALPDRNPNHPDSNRSDAEVRSEGFEFIVNGGGIFDGYSYESSYQPAKNLSKELGRLSALLHPLPGDVGLHSLDAMMPTMCNNPGNWCQHIPNWEVSDPGTCGDLAVNLYWSTLQSASDYLLYLHHGKRLGFDFDGYRASPCGGRSGGSTGYQTPNLQFSVTQQGCYLEYWLDPGSGVVLGHARRDLSPRQMYKAVNPPHFQQDAVFLLHLVNTGSCFKDPPLTASFTLNCNYLWCNFDASDSSPSSVISTYAWDWGDSTTTSSGIPQQLHVFAAPGDYQVTLTVSDLSGDTGVASQPVMASSQPPTPSFVTSCQLLTCTFDATNSQGGSAAIMSYSWTFGDGAGGVGFAPTHTYASAAVYTVTLTVTDDYGVMASTSQSVTVAGPPPTASFTFACSGMVCGFDGSASSSANSIAAYGWSFGDATGTSGVTASHTYAAAGTYTVTLTVTDTFGQTGTQTHQVLAANPPLASFTWSCAGLTCTLDGSGSTAGSGTITGYAWSFGDGATG